MKMSHENYEEPEPKYVAALKKSQAKMHLVSNFVLHTVAYPENLSGGGQSTKSSLGTNSTIEIH